MANPVIRNVALVSRYPEFALTSGVIVDGTSIGADGVLKRGTVLCKASLSTAKWHVFVHGTDTLAADLVRIVQDDIVVAAGVDAFASAYFKGFFVTSAIVDAMGGSPFVAADLTAAAGFHQISANELELK